MSKIIKAVKKPIEYEVMKFEGNNFEEIYKWVVEENNGKLMTETNGLDESQVYIETLEGNMRVMENAYIIKGIEGEFHPCKYEIFLKTYDIKGEKCKKIKQ